MAWEIGTVTVATALREELEEVLAAITGLSVRQLRRELHAARGNTHVRNALGHAWPWDAERLGPLRVALARDYGLTAELEYVTGLSARSIRRRLNSEHGRTLLRNAFSAHWPDVETSPTPTGRDAGGDEMHTRAARDLGARAVDGEQIAGRYTLGARLGRGGYGEVFEAWDELAHRVVVLKFANDDDMDVLRHEFGRVFDPSHPNICRVSLQHDQLTGRGFLVMPHAGRSVASLMREQGAFAVEDAVEIVLAVASALDFAHEHKIIHHDVSPDNILVDEKGSIRLTDFGVAVAATRRVTTRGAETLLGGTMIGLNQAMPRPKCTWGRHVVPLTNSASRTC